MNTQQGPKLPLDELQLLRQENEQLRELRDIVSIMLYRDAVSGEWPNESCRYCGGHSSGYWDSQDFVHSDDCVAMRIRAL